MGKFQDTLSDDLVSGERLLSGCTWFPFAVSSCGRDRDHLFQCFCFVSELISVMKMGPSWPQFSSVQSLSPVWLFSTLLTAAHGASLSITDSQNLLKLMSIESVMPSNHLILCLPFLLLPSIFPSLRVFPNESVLHIRWPLEFQLQHQSFQWIFRTDCL